MKEGASFVASGHSWDSAASFHKSARKTTKAPKPKKDGLPLSISQVLKRLPEPKLDEFMFESDVVRPQRDMVEKFPGHPGLVINKLNKVIEKEERRAESMAAEIDEVKAQFGLGSTALDGTVGVGRHLSAVKYELGLPPCP